MKKSFKIIFAYLLVFCFTLSSLQAMALEIDWDDKVHLPGLTLPIDETKMVKKGILVLEAEDIVAENDLGTKASAVEGASGDRAVHMTTQWHIEDSTSDELYSKIYVETEADAGAYKLWYRARNTHAESGSFWVNPNTGVWAAMYYNADRSGKWYWTSMPIDLKVGENYVAFRSRTSGYMDKIIITNNLAFKPEGKDDEPVYMTKEEEEAVYNSYFNEPSIKPIEGHPRLLISSANYDEVKAKVYSHPLKDQYYAYAYEDIDAKLDTSKSNNHNVSILTKIMSRALVWVMGDETDPAFAKKTIALMKDYLETVRTPDDAGDITRSRGNYLYGAAIVYDWCYDYLTDEDKEDFIDLMLETLGKKEIGWPLATGSNIANHTGEQEVFRDALGAGIAIYDEYPTLYNMAAGKMLDQMVPARRFLRKAGRTDMGHDYGLARGYSEVWADWHFIAMGYPSIYGEELMKNMWQWRIAARMPYGSMYPDGDMYSLTRTKYTTYYIDYGLAMCIAANIYKDSYLMQEWRRNSSIWSGSVYDSFFKMLADDTSAENDIWDDKPLTTLTSYPQSGFVAKTSWQEGFDSNAASAFVDMHEIYIGDHQMVYTGDFQIYYKGLLAMNTGTYNSSNQHNEGYSHRAIAANTMLIHDPDETFEAQWGGGTYKVANDGGQRKPNHGGASAVGDYNELMVNSDGISENDELTVAKDVKTYAGPNKITPEFSYVSGDLTNAYTDKVTDYHRSCVFIDLDNEEYPAAFVVFDKVSAADAKFKKTWLLHSQEKPSIKGNTTVIERSSNGFGGRLVNKTLTPERANQQISVIGGDAGEMFVTDVHTNGAKLSAIEGGNYRIELSPRQASKNDTFLNAMFVTDAGNTKELAMKKLDLGQFTGVSVMNKIVLFQKYAELADSKFSLSLKGSGELSVLIGGIKEGIWTITGGGKTQNIEVTKQSQVLMFKAKQGSYTIAPASEGTAADEVIAPKMNKKLIGDFFVWLDDSSSTDSRDGNYIYLKHPSKNIDGIPYISVDTLRYFGGAVSASGNSATIIKDDTKLNLTTDDKLKLIDGVLYINPQEVAELLGFSFTWQQNNNVLLAAMISE